MPRSAMYSDSMWCNLELPLFDALRTNRMPKPSQVACIADVRCDPVALPLASASIDLLILPHVIGFSSHPHQVLREAERVLGAGRLLDDHHFQPVECLGLSASCIVGVAIRGVVISSVCHASGTGWH